MRSLIFTILLLGAAYVAYTYFFGEGEEKANAEAIVKETKDLTKAVGALLGKQKERYAEGEFDELIDRVSQALKKLKANPSNTESEDELRQIGRDLHDVDTTRLTPEQKEKLRQVIRDIEGETNR